MHEPAGVVEILVQILQFTPILKSTPLPAPKIEIKADLGTLTFQFQNTPLPPSPTSPQKLKFSQILAL